MLGKQDLESIIKNFLKNWFKNHRNLISWLFHTLPKIGVALH